MDSTKTRGNKLNKARMFAITDIVFSRFILLNMISMCKCHYNPACWASFLPFLLIFVTRSNPWCDSWTLENTWFQFFIVLRMRLWQQRLSNKKMGFLKSINANKQRGSIKFFPRRETDADFSKAFWSNADLFIALLLTYSILLTPLLIHQLLILTYLRPVSRDNKGGKSLDDCNEKCRYNKSPFLMYF